MKKKFALLLILTFIFSTRIVAQVNNESFNNLGRQVGQLIAGGNVSLSAASTLGGLPHFSLGLSLNAINLKFTNPVDSSKKNEFFLYTGQVIGQIGLVRGISIMPTIGGLSSIDFILRGGITLGGGDNVENNAPMFALGARVGILRDSITSPALSFSAMYNRVLKLSFGDLGSDDFEIDANISSYSLRIDLSKNFFYFTPYVGGGLDLSRIDAGLDFLDVSTGQIESSDFKDNFTTKRFYGGVEINILLLHLTLEGGVAGENGFASTGIRVAI